MAHRRQAAYRRAVKHSLANLRPDLSPREAAFLDVGITAIAGLKRRSV